MVGVINAGQDILATTSHNPSWCGNANWIRVRGVSNAGIYLFGYIRNDLIFFHYWAYTDF